MKAAIKYKYNLYNVTKNVHLYLKKIGLQLKFSEFWNKVKLIIQIQLRLSLIKAEVKYEKKSS